MTCISSVLKSIHSRPPRLNRQFLQQLLHHIASCCVGILHTGRIYEDNMGMHMGSCCRANDAHLAKVDVCQFEILYFPKRAGIATSNWFPKLFTPTKSRHWLLLMFTSCLSTWIPHFFSDLSCHVMPCHAISGLLDQRKKGRLPIPLGRVDVIHHLLCQGLPIGIFELQHLPTWRTEGILESAKIVNLLIICKG